MVCNRKDIDIRNINLYVIGSEGLNVCEQCEMRLVEFVRGLRSLATTNYLQGYKDAKSNATNGESSDGWAKENYDNT